MGDETHPHEVFDLGLQQERTGLAWLRTGVTIAVAGAIYLRAAAVASLHVLWHVPGAVVLGLGFVTVYLGRRRYDELHEELREDGASAISDRLAPAIAVVTVVFSIISLGLILVAW